MLRRPIMVYASHEEHKTLRQAAAAAGLCLSTYVRWAALKVARQENEAKDEK